jgi:hypothetical protein
VTGRRAGAGRAAARAALVLGLGGGLAGCSDLVTAHEVVAPYYAKELCSCLFVAGQPEDACQAYVRHDLGVLDDAPVIDTDDDATIDHHGRTVTVDLLLNSATARYRDARLGCRLDP